METLGDAVSAYLENFDGSPTTKSQPNGLGIVPVVELTNRNRLLGGPESELVDVIPIADAISKLASDMMVSAEFCAMPRRWVTGIEIPERLECRNRRDGTGHL